MKRNLDMARRSRNDEFYTPFEYVRKEMEAHLANDPSLFRGKSVLCPCDDPDRSQFTRYFRENFARLGLKRLVSTCIAENPDDDLFSDGDWHGKACSVDAGGERRWMLEGNGDFRGAETTALLDNADMVITNPPFSLFREFMRWTRPEEKGFLLLGSINAITYNELNRLFVEDGMWLGLTSNFTDMVFSVPDGTDIPKKYAEKAKRLGYDGVNYTRLGNCCWFTNLDPSSRDGRRIEGLRTMDENINDGRCRFIREHGYIRYDNYPDAVECPSVMAIPSDFDGDVGVPITFLASHNPSQFRIVRIKHGTDGKELCYTLDGEQTRPYCRIIIRRVE